MRMMKKISWVWVVAACLAVAVPSAAQSQFQSTFEIGVGYTRPATENMDMLSFLVQADDFFVESGIGLRTNAGLGGDSVFGWMVRGGMRPFKLGNVRGHVGGEFSLFSNSTVNGDGDPATLLGLAFLVGGSYQVADHLNLAVHLYPLAFEFGGADTVTKLLVGEMGIHLLF
jgi:hypothetical protein